MERNLNQWACSASARDPFKEDKRKIIPYVDLLIYFFEL